jgi:hypothetical protein
LKAKGENTTKEWVIDGFLFIYLFVVVCECDGLFDVG